MSERPSTTTRKSPSCGSSGRHDDECGGETFNWSALVPHIVHPAKVAIIEALLWVGEPLSASDLNKLFGDSEFYVSSISYHAIKLDKAGVLKVARTRPVRGFTEKFYFFP